MSVYEPAEARQKQCPHRPRTHSRDGNCLAGECMGWREVDGSGRGYCGLAGMPPAKAPERNASDSYLEPWDLVGEFAEKCLSINDMAVAARPDLRTRVDALYKAFRDFCVQVKGLREAYVPSRCSFHRDIKSVPGLFRVGPWNYICYNAVVKECDKSRVKTPPPPAKEKKPVKGVECGFGGSNDA